MDLGSGFESYLQRKRSAGSHTIELMLRKRRRAERMLGPVRFVAATDDNHVLDTIIEWKRAQFARIRNVDQLAPAWRRAFLRRVAAFRSERFAGMTCALYAGKHLLAAHLGIRSGGVLHGWFSVYDRSFREYSPGIMLWATLAEHAPPLGIARIDLGKGKEHYKDRLKTGDVLLAEGAVDPWFVSRALRLACWRTRHALLGSRLANPLRRMVHMCRALRGYEIDQPPDARPSG
jgi:CelD/BcsL family acetyltransferase involved in cellulose biosynthesis